MNLDRIFAPVGKDLSSFEEALKEVLCSDSSLIYNVVEHILNGKGKRLRPALVFLCSRICGNRSQNACRAAVAVDLIHNASLLHDDVIDQSPTRHGQISVGSKWNNLVSILMGDYLLSKAFKVLNQTECLELLNWIARTAERLSMGELRQIQESRNYQLDEKSYLGIIQDKTASLFQASCMSGAVAGGGKKEQKRKLQQYGHNLGTSFQIVDDVLDFVGDTKKTGKGLGNDLKEGKVTLPLIYTLRQAGSSTRRRIIKLLEKDFNHQDFAKILSLVREHGGVEYAKWRALVFGQRASSFIADFRNSPYKKSLMDMVEFAVNRDR